MLIMLDGIDGSGKSTVMNAWKQHLRQSGNGFFDLVEYLKTNGEYPNISELKAYEFITSSEPTYAKQGRLLREELLKNGRGHSPQELAKAFSLDREILYQKIIIPCLQNDKVIIQDRGISSSLAYQPLSDQTLNIEYLSNLEGNALALKYRPDYLIILDIKPEEAIKRLSARTEKQDDSIFEKQEFLKKLADVYASPDFQNIFTIRGTKILHLDGSQKIDIMKKEAVDLLDHILNYSR